LRTVRNISISINTDTMSDYELDLEILYAVKDGHHNFNEIFSKVGGSKLKFSKRLGMLVKDGIIKKNKDGQYHLGEYETYEDIKTMIEGIKRRTSKIGKDSKTFSDKKLLEASVQTTILYLAHFSLLYFHILFTQFQTSKTAELEMAKELLRYIQKIYLTLEKRDPDLLGMYYDLVKEYTINLAEDYKK